MYLESSIWWAKWAYQFRRPFAVQYAQMEPPVSAKTLVTSVGHKSPVNLIVVPLIATPDEKSMIVRVVIDRCLESAGRYGAHVHTPTGSPGSYFPAGSWCFNALLGTNLNAPVALFLAQHKRDNLLGHKTLLGVAISNTKWLHDGVQTRPENSHHQDGDILGDTNLVWEVVAFRSGLDWPCAALWDRYQGGEKLPLVFDRRETRESRLVASNSVSSSAVTANQRMSLSSGDATQSSS